MMKFELEVYQGWMGYDPSTKPIALCKVAVKGEKWGQAGF